MNRFFLASPFPLSHNLGMELPLKRWPRIVGKLDHYALLAQEIYAVVLLGVVLVVLAGVGTVYCAVHPDRKIWE